MSDDVTELHQALETQENIETQRQLFTAQLEIMDDSRPQAETSALGRVVAAIVIVIGFGILFAAFLSSTSLPK